MDDMGGITLPNFKESKMWCWVENKHVDQQNKIENPEIVAHLFFVLQNYKSNSVEEGLS